MRTHRFGLVGTRYVCEFHIVTLKREPRVHIVGITDLDKAHGSKTARKFGIGFFFAAQDNGSQGTG